MNFFEKTERKKAVNMQESAYDDWLLDRTLFHFIPLAHFGAHTNQYFPFYDRPPDPALKGIFNITF